MLLLRYRLRRRYLEAEPRYLEYGLEGRDTARGVCGVGFPE